MDLRTPARVSHDMGTHSGDGRGLWSISWTGLRFLTFVVSNLDPDGRDAAGFLASVAEVERRAGFDFVWKLGAVVDDALESVGPSLLR
ncbi:MAG: hypothetical protein Kow0097_14420 [Candidatus Bipolaricaulota bacterium]